MTTDNQEVQPIGAEDTGETLEKMTDEQLEALVPEQPPETPLTKREMEKMLKGHLSATYSYVDKAVNKVRPQGTAVQQAPSVYLPPLQGEEVDPHLRYVSQQLAALAAERAQEKAVARQRLEQGANVQAQKRIIEGLANRMGVSHDKVDWAEDTLDLSERWERATESISKIAKGAPVAKKSPEDILKRRKELQSAETSPTAKGGRTFEDIEQGYADGTVSYERYAEALKARQNK